jgi:hypothetical protein
MSDTENKPLKKFYMEIVNNAPGQENINEKEIRISEFIAWNRGGML